MSQRRPQRHNDAQSKRPKGDAGPEWDSPEFLRSTLITLAFIAAPAIVMAALKEYTIAAVWLSVGVLIVAVESRRQIRGLWRALRAERHPETKKDDEPPH